MEPTTLVIIALLLFGGYEHIQNEKAEERIETLETQLQETKQNYETTKEVNENNASTIATIDNARLQCLFDLKESKARQADFERINQNSAIRIEKLEGIVSGYDWSSVRIPSGLVDKITTD